MYLYICIHVYMYLYICMHMWSARYEQGSAYTCICVPYIHTCVSYIHTCDLNVRVHTYYICIYIYTYVYIYIYSGVIQFFQICTCMCSHSFISKPKLLYTRMKMSYTHICIGWHDCLSVYHIYLFIFVRMYVRIHPARK